MVLVAVVPLGLPAFVVPMVCVEMFMLVVVVTVLAGALRIVTENLMTKLTIVR